jgi:hypothetical protein
LIDIGHERSKFVPQTRNKAGRGKNGRIDLYLHAMFIACPKSINVTRGVLKVSVPKVVRQG